MAIILSKVRQPQKRPRVLKRIRLLDRLHQNLHRKLNFISAPAGYGKTTLLVEYANDVDAVVCWYHIGSGETDLTTFFEYVIAAFQQQYPEFGNTLIEMIKEGTEAPSPGFLATELINEIHAKIDDFTLLILDDYHVVDSVDVIVEFIEAVLEHLPNQLRILIGSRSFYGVPTATLYIREDIATLGAEDLQFRPDEFQTLMSQHYQIKINRVQAEDLVKRSEGWIVALLLVVRGLKPGVTLPQFKGATEQVFAFLAEEVLKTLPDNLKDFMLVTSIFDEFDIELCNFVLDITNSAEYILDIEARNLFLSRVETREGTAYRYHQLFAEFLKNQLSQFQEKKFNELNRRAAEGYYQKENWDLAIHHMLASGDIQTTAGWMDSKALILFATGQHNLLSRWFESLGEPKEAAGLAPTLTLYKAKLLTNSGNSSGAGNLLDLAEPLFAKRKENEMLATSIVTRGWIEFYQNQDKKALQLAKKAQQIIEQSNLDNYQWYQAEQLIGKILIRLGQNDEALEHFIKASNEFKRLLDDAEEDKRNKYLHDYFLALLNLGQINFITGRIFEAEKAYSEAKDISLKYRGNRRRITLAGNDMAYLYHQLGEYGEAWRVFELALNAATEVNSPSSLALIHSGRGDLLRDIDEFEMAEENYLEAIELEIDTEWQSNLRNTYLGYAILEQARMNFSKAQYYVREAARIADESVNDPQYQLHMGWIYLRMGQYELAVEELGLARLGLETSNALNQEYVLTTFLLSCAQFKCENVKLALSLLEETMRAAAKMGYEGYLVIAGRGLPEFIEYARERIPSPHLESFYGKIKGFKTGLDAYIGIKIEEKTIMEERLEVRGFGPGRVWRNGELIPNSAWRSSRSRALFFFILERKKVRKEEIALEFWPDFSPAKVSSNFHTTLWRVRKALGEGDIVAYDDEFYHIAPETSVWYDAEEFRELLGRAGKKAITQEERLELWRNALDLYQGEFLEDLHLNWVQERNYQLKELVLKTMRNLAFGEFEANRLEESKRICQEYIKIDPYQDDIHLLLMKNLVALGTPSAAISHYQSYHDQLTIDLSIEPSEVLVQYYSSLLN